MPDAGKSAAQTKTGKKVLIMNKILVIDDNRDLCALIKKSVLQDNIKADCCYLGTDGLHKLKTHKYQLVILDVMMPEPYNERRDVIAENDVCLPASGEESPEERIT